MNNVRYAARQLVGRPALSLAIVLTLALGIGATTAIFSIYHQVLLRPLPVPEPQALVNFGAPGPKPGYFSCLVVGSCRDAFSYPMFRDLEREQEVFTGIAAHRVFSAHLNYQGAALSASGLLVSGSYFSVLGLQPALGRLLGLQDEPRVGESAVVVLSHAYWRNELGADPAVIGRRLTVNGTPMTIVGVAPEGFTGTTLGHQPRIYAPLTMAWALQPTFPRNHDVRTAYWLYLFARRKPGVRLEQAEATMNAHYSAILNEIEAPLNTELSESLLEQFRERQLVVESGARGQSVAPETAQLPLTLMQGVTALVLLIGCVNIANLLLARGAARSGEMAVRAAVGASRRRLLAQLMTESALLAALGFAASIPVAMLTINGFSALAPLEIARVFNLELSLPAIAFGFGVAGLTMLAFGLLPAWQASRIHPATALNGQAGQTGAGRGMARFRDALATSQIALSTTLLALAALFTLSLFHIARIDLGLNPEPVVTFAVSPRLNGYSSEQALQLYERLEEELAAQPGVTHAAGAAVPLFSGGATTRSVSIEGLERGSYADTIAYTNEVGPDYFEVLQMPLLRGRAFARADRIGAPTVAVVNEAFARKFELGADVIGRRFTDSFRDAAESIEIVGLVADSRYADVKEASPPPQFFVPWRQSVNLGTLSFYVRTALDPDQLLPSIPGIVTQLDPNLPVDNLATMPLRVRESAFIDRMVSVLSAAFAVLATLLAAIGVYGVLAYGVARRTREIGLRIALGAAPDRVLAMVLKQVGRIALIGCLLGLTGAVVIGRFAEALLFGLSGYDPVVLALVVVVQLAVVLIAGYLPARRASRVAPMEALRHE